MALSDAMVSEFQQILREEFGLEIPKKEAVVVANGLVGYFDLLAQMKHKTNNEDY